MHTCNLSAIPSRTPPLGLTIGTFDGVHLGHHHLIHSLRMQLQSRGTTAVLTFKNHPSHVLPNRPAALLLCTPAHKVKLLAEAGVNLLILEEFDAELSMMPYDDFIKYLRSRYPFTHLVLGEDARFGKERLGTKEKIEELGKEEGFQASYIPPLHIEGTIVSSKRIRSCIAAGKLKEASQLLGRPYSILTSFSPATLTAVLPELCLPSPGIYSAVVNETSCLARIAPPYITLQGISLTPDPVEVFLSSTL